MDLCLQKMLVVRHSLAFFFLSIYIHARMVLKKMLGFVHLCGEFMVTMLKLSACFASLFFFLHEFFLDPHLRVRLVDYYFACHRVMKQLSIWSKSYSVLCASVNLRASSVLTMLL